MKLPRILQVVLAILLLAAGTHFEAGAHPPRKEWPPQAPGFEYLGYIKAPGVAELSGLANSRRVPHLLWGINDSGNPASLIAMTAGGEIHGEVPVEGVTDTDWEDLAGFEQDGQPYLAISDAGDNFDLRKSVEVIIVPEPDPAAKSVKPVRVLRFTYSDGPRDVESLAVDVPGRRLLLADKGLQPPGLYELSLDGADTGRIAQRIADFPNLVPTPPPRVQPIGSRWRGSPTAMDLSADGRRMIVLTYESLTVFDRKGDESWAQALRHPVSSVRVPPMGLLESVVFDPDEKSAVIATEGPWAHFYRWHQVPPIAAVP